jgi:hypothetical protein
VNRSTDATVAVVVPVGIATADVGVVRAGRVALAVQAVVVVQVALAALVVAVAVVRAVLVALAVPAEAEVRREHMVQSSPGTVRPETKAVRRRVAGLVGPCRVPRTNASTPTTRIRRAALVLRAIPASTSAVLGLRREIVHRAARDPKVPLAARRKAMAGATTVVVPTVGLVPRMPPVVLVVVAVRAMVAVDPVRARAGRKADLSPRATIAIGAVAAAADGTSPPFP